MCTSRHLCFDSICTLGAEVVKLCVSLFPLSTRLSLPSFLNPHVLSLRDEKGAQVMYQFKVSDEVDNPKMIVLSNPLYNNWYKIRWYKDCLSNKKISSFWIHDLEANPPSHNHRPDDLHPPISGSTQRAGLRLGDPGNMNNVTTLRFGTWKNVFSSWKKLKDV